MLEGMRSRGKMGCFLTAVIKKDISLIETPSWYQSYDDSSNFEGHLPSRLLGRDHSSRQTASFRKGLIIFLFIWSFVVHNCIYICILNRVERSFPQGEFRGCVMKCHDTSAGHTRLYQSSLLLCFLKPRQGCWQKQIRLPTKSHRDQITDSPVLQPAAVLDT